MKTTYDAVNEFKGEWHGSKDKVYICGTGVITDYDQFNDLVSQMETNFGKCDQSYSDYKFDYHLSPQPALTYTQAMADNGELPSVGMEFISTEFGKGVNAIVKVITDEFIIYTFANGKSGECCIEICANSHKPLTPPIEPEEQALNDMMEQLKNEGICSYDPIMLRILIAKFKANKIHGVSFQPLTVEVK